VLDEKKGRCGTGLTATVVLMISLDNKKGQFAKRTYANKHQRMGSGLFDNFHRGGKVLTASRCLRFPLEGSGGPNMTRKVPTD
jgi:hypothetical protein